MSVFEKLPTSVIYFSDLLNIKISDQEQKSAGRLVDIFVDFEDIYPHILGLKIRYKKKYYYLKWDDIKIFSLKKIIIKSIDLLCEGSTFPKTPDKKIVTNILANQFSKSSIDYPPLGKLILDKQIVDIYGKKVVRVNDIHLVKFGQTLRVTHAAIGFLSILRRLGYGKMISLIKKTIKNKSNFLSEKVINWKYVHAIPDKNINKNVKLNVSDIELRDLHPADLADILEDLDKQVRVQVFNELDIETAANTLTEIDEEFQNHIIHKKSSSELAKMISIMGVDEAADFLSELPEQKITEVLSLLDDYVLQEEITELLSYDEDTAGGLMSTELFTAFADDTPELLFQKIRENHSEFESIYDIYIIDEFGKFEGSTTLKDILLAPPSIKIKEIMVSDDLKFLDPEDDWRTVAKFMSKYNLINVPVVDEEKILLGLVSVDDILPWLLDD